MPVFTDHVRRIVQRIPAGKVLDYKTVACLAGSPDAAMAVGRAMGPPGETPGWHRVVNAKGQLTSPCPKRQHKLLVRDRVKFKANGILDMAVCRWNCAAVKSSI